MKRIVFDPEARQELRSAVIEYNRVRPGLGREFRAEARRILGLIQRHPKIGTPFEDSEIRYSVLDRFPYVIYYGELEHAIWIAAVAHGSQRPAYWRRRKPT